jgi:hypothetical protein
MSSFPPVLQQQSVAMLELMQELLPRLNDDACRQDFSRAVLLLARRLRYAHRRAAGFFTASRGPHPGAR